MSMSQENVQDIERADGTVPPLPDAETDDLGAAMIDNEDDKAVEDRLESEDEEFQDEMQDEGNTDATEEEEGTA